MRKTDLRCRVCIGAGGDEERFNAGQSRSVGGAHNSTSSIVCSHLFDSSSFSSMYDRNRFLVPVPVKELQLVPHWDQSPHLVTAQEAPALVSQFTVYQETNSKHT